MSKFWGAFAASWGNMALSRGGSTSVQPETRPCTGTGETDESGDDDEAGDNEVEVREYLKVKAKADKFSAALEGVG